MTAFLDIRNACADAIESAPAFVGSNVVVYRGRATPLPVTVQRAVNVRLFRALGTVAGIDNGPNDWDTQIQTEIHVRDPGDPETLADQMLGVVFEALASVELPGLGPMDVLSRPEIDWEVRDADSGHVCVTLYSRVIHRTQGLTLNPWS